MNRNQQARQTVPRVVATVDLYTEAWNRHDVDTILSLHADDAVFENHTSGGLAVGKAELRKMIEGIFDTFPDLSFSTRRAYAGNDFAVVEWTARATHAKPIARGAQVFPPTGKALAWDGVDVLPMRGGKILRKDVYADSISFLQQLGVAAL